MDTPDICKCCGQAVSPEQRAKQIRTELFRDESRRRWVEMKAERRLTGFRYTHVHGVNAMIFLTWFVSFWIYANHSPSANAFLLYVFSSAAIALALILLHTSHAEKTIRAHNQRLFTDFSQRFPNHAKIIADNWKVVWGTKDDAPPVGYEL